MKRLSLPTERLKSHYDVVVVGSGYGGGVAASRLARMGRKVCVLERGREFLPGEFPSRFPDMRQAFRMVGGKVHMGPEDALFDCRLGQDIHVLLGAGLGGGSLVNAAVALRPDPRLFDNGRWPQAFRDDPTLAEGFARAERMLAPTTCPEGTRFPKYRAFAEASETIGKPAQYAPILVRFTEGKNHAGVEQAACTHCGDCCSGCNVGAKNTVAVTYLPDAHHHGAEIFTQITVTHVTREDGIWQIFWRPTGEPETPSRQITANLVVLAAGTLGSTEILLRSREKGLPLSDRLGQGFSANGDIIAFGYKADRPVHAVGIGHPPKADLDPVGPSVVGLIRYDDPEDLTRSMIVEEGAMPSPLAPLMPVMFVPGGRLLGALKSLIQGVYKGPLAATQTFFAVSHDDAGGRIVLKNDQVAIEWPGVSDQPIYARLDETLRRITEAIGGQYVRNPLSESVLGRNPATAHPLGGCGMGEDRTQGVVDHKCRVFDGSPGAPSDAVLPGLYVCDGAVIPGALGVNPLLTITALAERAMIYLARDKNWAFDDSPLP